MSIINSTTRFCKKCQAETQRNMRGACKPCAKAATALWIAANPDKMKASRAAWKAANREKVNTYAVAWHAAHSERKKVYDAVRRARNPAYTKAISAAYYAANQERLKVVSAAYRINHPEKALTRVVAWAKANPEALRAHRQNRRARKRKNGGVLSTNLSAKLFKLQQGKCACCGEPLGDKYHMDHIMPLDLGGPNIDSNIQLLRQRCNQQKHTRHLVDFMQSRGFLL